MPRTTEEGEDGGKAKAREKRELWREISGVLCLAAAPGLQRNYELHKGDGRLGPDSQRHGFL